MTMIALIRADRVAALYATKTPASYVELPRWAQGYEGYRELPDTLEAWEALEESYQIELVGSGLDAHDQPYDRYRLTPYAVGADGQLIKN